MRLVIALGGNALLRRGEPLTAAVQRHNVRRAAEVLAPVIRQHQVVITHGNGPQVGLLALQSAAYRAVPPYPLDVLGAESEGMIGYMIEQELLAVLDPGFPIATILTMIEVDRRDPAFGRPTKPIGPLYALEEARRIEQERGWAFTADGEHYRRVVPSPLPKDLLEARTIEILVQAGITVVCAGGGGIPVVRTATGTLQGIEAVIDKDWASELVARLLGADGLIMLTDVCAVELDHGKPSTRAIRTAHPQALAEHHFEAGSMGPKVEAARAFANETGRFAAIGALADLPLILTGDAGTRISLSAEGLQLAR